MHHWISSRYTIDHTTCRLQTHTHRSINIQCILRMCCVLYSLFVFCKQLPNVIVHSTNNFYFSYVSHTSLAADAIHLSSDSRLLWLTVKLLLLQQICPSRGMTVDRFLFHVALGRVMDIAGKKKAKKFPWKVARFDFAVRIGEKLFRFWAQSRRLLYANSRYRP